MFPQAAGSLQSPVNIETSKSTNDTTLKCKPLYWNYCPEMCTKIVNTGYGWKVDATGGEGSGMYIFVYYFFIAIHFFCIENIVEKCKISCFVRSIAKVFDNSPFNNNLKVFP